MAKMGGSKKTGGGGSIAKMMKPAGKAKPMGGKMAKPFGMKQPKEGSKADLD